MKWDDYEAALFDLDGVLTPTAEVHMSAWAQMFSEFLVDYPGQPPYTDQDYFDHVDGKPRYEGVAAFLASRGLDLPLGEPSDEPTAPTVCGLGNRKNAVFAERLAREGIAPYAGSIQLMDHLETLGVAMAVVSSSKNAPDVLAAAAIAERFGVVVDGAVAAEHGIPGKPRPDTYAYAADQLGVPHTQCVVFEDAISGVQAGAAGDFGLVVGVDRGAGSDVLSAHGAQLVVADLAELI
ncbi:MAG TPA: HAD-IA family hydrolase [Ornithinimicrobium sp.]|uniref:HAD family hydrolase n=1 Tax=Ornithinimicrobium sp. TaxID=1977084 RepID=UPI002B4A8614|nr:HAD-IA family hydrolase [Ornithinimicrobium sp.]HKJ10916.1 HAD-IA family hydrolase [Ornithinimicrobium sp.]